VSGFQSFEAFDPAEWVTHGYAVVNVDARGVFGTCTVDACKLTLTLTLKQDPRETLGRGPISKFFTLALIL
jgi:hypothetical protein